MAESTVTDLHRAAERVVSAHRRCELGLSEVPLAPAIDELEETLAASADPEHSERHPPADSEKVAQLADLFDYRLVDHHHLGRGWALYDANHEPVLRDRELHEVESWLRIQSRTKALLDAQSSLYGIRSVARLALPSAEGVDDVLCYALEMIAREANRALSHLEVAEREPKS